MDGITKSVKMWPLQSMINLVKFRAFSEVGCSRLSSHLFSGHHVTPILDALD